MKICLSCGHLTTSLGQGGFCGHCGRSFGRICPKGHLNPLYARHCRVCGVAASQMSKPTTYLPLGCLPPLLALLLLAVAFRFAWQHLAGICCVSERFSLGTLAFLFDSSPRSIVEGAINGVIWFGVCYGLAGLLPGSASKSVRHAMLWALKTTASLVRKGIVLVLHLCLPTAARDRKKGKK